MAISHSRYDEPAGNLTANVNLWPRPEVLFANSKAFAGLDERQRKALLAAARVAQVPTTELLELDAQTKAVIAEVRELGAGVPADAPTCSSPSSVPTGERTPLDGVWEHSSTRAELARALRTATADTVVPLIEENWGKTRFVLSRGEMRFTWANGEFRAWATATYTVDGDIFEFTITGQGGEAPNGAMERPGEVYTYRWSLYRDRLKL